MIGAILFAIVIGLLMQALFRKEDEDRRANEQMFQYEEQVGIERMDPGNPGF
ncbi:MAG TPA: hypothetical protein PLG79_04390 [Spirochaetales bacterium]|nr:hypothetical protein [Spirochaetales bacterium]